MFLAQELLKYYEVIDTFSFLTQDKIIISLDFPLALPGILQYYHLFSFSNENQKVVQLHFLPRATKNAIPGRRMHRLTIHIVKKFYFCQTKEWITDISPTNHSPTSCKRVLIYPPERIIENINQSHYIVIFPEKVQHFCNQTMSQSLRDCFNSLSLQDLYNTPCFNIGRCQPCLDFHVTDRKTLIRQQISSASIPATSSRSFARISLSQLLSLVPRQLHDISTNWRQSFNFRQKETHPDHTGEKLHL